MAAGLVDMHLLNRQEPRLHVRLLRRLRIHPRVKPPLPLRTTTAGLDCPLRRGGPLHCCCCCCCCCAGGAGCCCCCCSCLDNSPCCVGWVCCCCCSAAGPCKPSCGSPSPAVHWPSLLPPCQVAPGEAGVQAELQGGQPGPYELYICSEGSDRQAGRRAGGTGCSTSAVRRVQMR